MNKGFIVDEMIDFFYVKTPIGSNLLIGRPDRTLVDAVGKKDVYFHPDSHPNNVAGGLIEWDVDISTIDFSTNQKTLIKNLETIVRIGTDPKLSVPKDFGEKRNQRRFNKKLKKLLESQYSSVVVPEHPLFFNQGFEQYQRVALVVQNTDPARVQEFVTDYLFYLTLHGVLINAKKKRNYRIHIPSLTGAIGECIGQKLHHKSLPEYAEGYSPFNLSKFS